MMKNDRLFIQLGSLSSETRAELLFEQAERAIQKGQLTKAIAALESLCELSTFQRIDILKLLAKLYVQVNQSYKAALLWLQASQNALFLGNLEDACEFLQESLHPRFNENTTEDHGRSTTALRRVLRKCIAKEISTQYVTTSHGIQDCISFFIGTEIRVEYHRFILALASSKERSLNLISPYSLEEQQFFSDDYHRRLTSLREQSIQIVQPEKKIAVLDKIRFLTKSVQEQQPATVVADGTLAETPQCLFPLLNTGTRFVLLNREKSFVADGADYVFTSERNSMHHPCPVSILPPVVKAKKPTFSSCAMPGNPIALIVLLPQPQLIDQWAELLEKIISKLPAGSVTLSGSQESREKLLSTHPIIADCRFHEDITLDSIPFESARICIADAYSYPAEVFADALCAGVPSMLLIKDKNQDEFAFPSMISDAFTKHSLADHSGILKKVKKLCYGDEEFQRLSLIASSQATRYSFQKVCKQILQVLSFEEKKEERVQQKDSAAKTKRTEEPKRMTAATKKFVPPNLHSMAKTPTKNEKTQSKIVKVKEYMAQAEYTEAVALLVPMLQINPDIPQLLLLQAECTLQLNDIKSAKKALSRVQNMFPENKRAIELENQIAEKERLVLESDSNQKQTERPEDVINCALKTLKSGAVDEAIAMLKELKPHEASIDYHYSLALCYAKKSENELSLFHAEQEILAFPTNKAAGALLSALQKTERSQ